MVRKNYWPLVLGLSTMLQASCGKKKDDRPLVPKDVQVAETPNCDLSKVGCAVTFTGATMAPTLPDGDYVGVSFVLSDTSRQEGGSEEGNPIEIDNKSKFSLTDKNFLPEFVDLNYMGRIIANRYSRHAAEGDPIWNLIRSYDEAAESQLLASGMSLFEYFKNDQKKGYSTSSMPLTSSSICPEGKVDVGTFGGEVQPTSRLEGKKVCVLVKDSLTGSVTNEDIKAWSDGIVARYEEIFGAQPTIDGFSGTPWILVMDTSAIPLLQDKIAVFVRAPTEANKHPILILNKAVIASGATRIDTLGTMAHEIYHGISYYYKVAVNKKDIETEAIDEGIAHVMEDVFGNSAKIETDWTATFIGAALDNVYPVLNSDSLKLPRARGGAHSFMYFLTDMFGGLSSSSAATTSASGGGINLLRDIIKSPNKGVQNIEAITGFKMTQLMGDFAATVILDQSSIKAQSERWTLKGKFPLTALSGDKVEVGHRFTYDVSTLSELTSDEIATRYYTLNAFLWTQAATKKLEFASVNINTALTLVRIK